MMNNTSPSALAEAFAKSRLFGITTPEQALTLMALADAAGRHPATILHDYHIIQGRAAMRADTMLARFQQAGGSVAWVSLTNERAEATFTHPQSGTLTLAWTIDDAKAAGLHSRPMWRQYPRAMLRSRLIAEAVRTCLPQCLQGLYTPEELADIPATTTEWPRIFEDHAEAINHYLQDAGILQDDQSFHDMPDGNYKKQMINHPTRFLAAVEKGFSAP